MDPIAPVVVEEVAEGDMALVVPDLGEHSCAVICALTGPGARRHLGEFADDQRLQPRRAEQLLRLRIERGEVERDEDVGLAVLDLELERAAARRAASS